MLARLPGFAAAGRAQVEVAAGTGAGRGGAAGDWARRSVGHPLAPDGRFGLGGRH